MVGVPRIELGTSVLSGLRSSQLSYTPAVLDRFGTIQSKSVPNLRISTNSSLYFPNKDLRSKHHNSYTL